ncbi:MAG: N-acetylmuramoyl-L-alanine amidase [Chitinispirillaceae bacterium]|nr:N-acetylmuramoyl-L-alanine amidase [Chitinispirillaceae bacterium]
MKHCHAFIPVLLGVLHFLTTGSCRAQTTKSPETPSLRAIVEVADSLGYSCRWERTFRRLSCTRQPLRFRFYEDNCFYYVNGSVERLPVAPVRIGPTLFLPGGLLTDILGENGGSSAPVAVSDGERIELGTAAGKGFTIRSVVTEKKSNGTLLTIALSDSLPLEVTYFYPNLTFNLYGGKLDTNSIRQGKRIGLVDSIFSHQFGKSAQITALLVREIEEPMVDYVSDTRTVLVSIWPKKNPKPKQTPSVKKEEKQKSGAMVIVLDPGHGGKDPGCIGADGTREKDVVLSIALKVRKALGKKKNIKVYMTRDSDEFIPLSDRTKFANDMKAHLFVSIHADAIGGNTKRKQSISGYKIYFLSQAKNEEDKLVAMRENAVIKLEKQPKKYSNLQNVLIEMAGNEYLRESQELCIMLDAAFSKSLGKKISKLHRGIGQANFWVLNGAFMPSVLIETGFLSHKKEEKLLQDKTFQIEMASAIGNAVLNFCDGIGAVHE